MKKFDSILKSQICIGCGLCESIGKSQGYRVTLDTKGFYCLECPKKRDPQLEYKMARICPSVNIEGDGSSQIWGNTHMIVKAHSTDEQLRYKASSGAYVSAVCCYMLESDYVNAILHVGVESENPSRNILKISKSVDEVRLNASSRYAPSVMYNNLLQILDTNTDTYAVVGKSCDILAIKNFLKEYPHYIVRFKFFIAIFCAGMPSYKATEKIISSFGKGEALSIKYRGNGWPGYFTASYSNNSEEKKSYADSWINYLGKDIHFRCKVCPDSVGTLADISVYDAWNLTNGKPDLTEDKGESGVLVRTNQGAKIQNELVKQNYVECSNLTLSDLSLQQINHIRKRTSSGYKIFYLNIILRGLFKTKNLALLRLSIQYNLIKGLRDMYGSWLRYKKWLAK